MDIATIMDAIAEALIPIHPRSYAWPSGTVSAPCFVVGYPDDFSFDTTMGRGSDSCTFPTYYVAGAKADRATRDELAKVIGGADSVKEALDGDLDGAVSSCYVSQLSIEQISVGDVPYMAIRFDVEVIA